jgi:hypothetical protein
MSLPDKVSGFLFRRPDDNWFEDLDYYWDTVDGAIFKRARFLGKLWTDSASFLVPHSGHSITCLRELDEDCDLVAKHSRMHFSHKVWPHPIKILGTFAS